MVSLLLRPLVCPTVPKMLPEKRLEVRFFVPGGLIANLDFVESIFGNAGDPYLPANDAGLDVDGWTGHSGCVILAPHLTRVRKKDVGLPHVSDASEKDRATGMCWTDEGEIMGVRHRAWPLHGVQFHPESFLTAEGPRLLQNFLQIGKESGPAG